MPESFNDRATPPGAPAKLGGAQGATNAEPSTKGTAAGGTDNIRADYYTREAGSTRPETSPLKPSRAPQHFDGTKV
jgi:hypothetical protein